MSLERQSGDIGRARHETNCCRRSRLDDHAGPHLLDRRCVRSRRARGIQWQPWLTQLAKQIVGAALVLVVAFLVLRPLMKSLTKPARRSSRGAADDLEGDRVSLSGQGKPIKLSPSFEQQIAAARTLVGQDPRRAAQVVKEWVSADG